MVRLGLVAAGLALALSNRFVQDDAFISFHYARSLAEGQGLTWFGVRVEGYTNFLWVLWLALGHLMRADAVVFAHVTGLLLFGAVLWMTWDLAQSLSEPGKRATWTAGLAVLLLATNYSVSCYATGGLETVLQAALILGALRCVDRPLALSLLALAGALTRLDTAAALLPIGAVALYRTRWRPPALARLILPVTVGLGAYVAWKISYYGAVLPNTFFAKVGGFRWTGLLFVGRFFHWYLLWPALLLALPRARAAALPLAVLACWTLYVVRVGGDFMEFRFMVPVAAPLMAVIAAGLVRWGPRLAVPAAVALVAASFWHARHFTGITQDRTLDSIDALATLYGRFPDRDWEAVGRAVGEDLAGLDVLIALQPVGAIPYYSRVRTLDMWGLNDAEVARHGAPVPSDYARPGHRRSATLRQLEDRFVQLVFAEPLLIRPGTLRSAAPEHLAQLNAFVQGARLYADPLPKELALVALPIDENRSLVALYLMWTDALSRRIGERGWETRLLYGTR